MTRNLTRTPAMTLAAAALAWLAAVLAPPGGGAEGEQRSFTLSTEPDAVILQYNYGGGMRPAVVYTLYGDGRLVHERVQEAAKHVSDHVEVELGFLERVELVRIIVDAGLLECDPACIEKKCAQLRGVNRIPPTADCGGPILNLNLESYQGPGDSAPHPVQRRDYLDCPRGLVSYYCTESELPEVKGLLDLGRALHEHKSAAQGVDP